MDTLLPSQQDEGYSEDPLNPIASSTALPKSRHDDIIAASIAAHKAGSNDLPPWLLRHLSSLSIANKTQLAMSLLDDLPTSVISQIVQRLSPRLYIDFINYLPAEICLKILGYLDPVSLITVARSCRAWYDLALDRKLWETLYFMEGWQAVDSEIKTWEAKVNENLNSSSGPQQQHSTSSEDGHVSKKRAISMSPSMDRDSDLVMIDADRPLKQEPMQVEPGEGSLFGGPSAAGLMRSSMTPGMGDLNMDGSGTSWTSKLDTKLGSLDKGKGKATNLPSPQTEYVKSHSLPEMFPSENPGAIPKSTLWLWDSSSSRYRISWKYLYAMRRRLERNWDLGKFTNFQFPHPHYPDEGHTECIYSIQFNSEYLVSGSRDDTIRIWSMQTRRLVLPPLTGHRGSVLCLQFDSDPEEDLIVSGSSDSDVILWKFSTGQIIQRLTRAHRESVLNVKFDKRILVTCSKDKTIKIFNRRELRAGDLGYGEVPVNPVAIHLKNYGYDGLDTLPIKPPYTMIGSLEGHSAAVNAVQICGREVVSASGDRNVKIWDWPNQSCLRTFVGHNKGIACVQYDGRRIVSGSSDNEVKVFDRPSGVELTSLKSHSNLVRTVQAGFADLPYSAEEDAAEAAKVDAAYYRAVEQGIIATGSADRRQRRHQGNAGGSNPEEILAVGAKLPPGGGGSRRYARIVSGSYDASIIIWRRNLEGHWKDQHHLRQEDAALVAARREMPAVQLHAPQPVGVEAATAAVTATARATAPAAQGSVTPTQGVPVPSNSAALGASATPAASSRQQILPPPVLPTMSYPNSADDYSHPHHHYHNQQANGTNATAAVTPSASSSTIINPNTINNPATQQAYLARLVDATVPQGVHVLQEALRTYPAMLALQSHIQAAIDREENPFARSQLRQAVSTATVRTQIAQARARQQLGIQGLLNGPSASVHTGPGRSGSGSSSAPPESGGGYALPGAAGQQEQQQQQQDGGIGSAGAGENAGGSGGQQQQEEGSAHVSSSWSTTATVAAPAHHHHHHDQPNQQHPAVATADPTPTQITTISAVPAGITGAPPPPLPPPPPRPVPHHPHMAGADVAGAGAGGGAAAAAAAAAAGAANSPRVFKLQFDARRIICCSQTGVIVGWDFCNGDEELEEAARFFATVE